MSGARSGRWLVLVIFILCLFGSCTLLAGGVNMDWGPAFLLWLVLVVVAKVLNDRWERLKWPMDFITWSIIALIAINLVWLGIPRP